MNNNILMVRKNIRQLSPYTSAREEYTGTEGIFLDANENPVGTYNRYPDPLQSALKAKLSAWKGAVPENIFIGNGSDEVIDLAFRIFCEPHQNKALTFTPTYGMYSVAAQINAIPLINLPLTQDFQIDRETLSPWLKEEELKLILLCSPNNPTGNLIRKADVTWILERFQGIVLIDEAYVDFCPQDSFLPFLDQYPRLIISQTLSKAAGMAGLRLGIAYAHEDIIRYYNKVKAPYNISTANQEAALSFFETPDTLRQQVHQILTEKIRLTNALQVLKRVKQVYPSDTNFILVEVDDANLMYEQLRDHNIIVRNRHTSVPNCLRITVGSPAENEQLINTLNTIDHA